MLGLKTSPLPDIFVVAVLVLVSHLQIECEQLRSGAREEQTADTSSLSWQQQSANRSRLLAAALSAAVPGACLALQTTSAYRLGGGSEDANSGLQSLKSTLSTTTCGSQRRFGQRVIVP